MDDFKIMNKVKYLIRYADDYLFESFPKYHLAIKINLEKCLYNLLEESIRARINSGNIRVKHIREIIVNISMIDYYVGEMNDKKIIIKKRYISFINCLNEISKMCYGWLSYEEKKKSVS